MTTQTRTVVITGGSRGLGKALAVEFIRLGALVVIGSRSQDSMNLALALSPDPKRVLGMQCDVRDFEQARALALAAVRKFGEIDLWINNAGSSHPYQKMMDVAPARWRESFDTNFLGTYHGSRAALENMLPRQQGRIINILGFGADRPAPNQSAYGTSKAAVFRLTQTLAQEYAASGVAICAVQPGMIWTEMLTSAEGVDPKLQSRFEWAMRVFGNAPRIAAQWVAEVAMREGVNGRLYRMVTARVFVPRMIRELLGAGKRDPHPWANLAD